MKKYTVWLAMASTALVQTAEPEKPLTKIEVQNALTDDSPLFAAAAFISHGNVAIRGEENNPGGGIKQITKGRSNQELLFPTFPQGSKGALLVSKNKAELEAFINSTSMMELRLNRAITFKAIPSGCTGTVIFKVSKGRIGTLRIDVNKTEKGDCRRSKLEQAYDAAKKKFDESIVGKAYSKGKT